MTTNLLDTNGTLSWYVMIGLVGFGLSIMSLGFTITIYVLEKQSDQQRDEILAKIDETSTRVENLLHARAQQQQQHTLIP